MTSRSTAPAPDFAHEIARFCRSLKLDQVAVDVQDKARLALCNVVGVAIGGASTDTAKAAVRWARMLEGPAQARAIGLDLVAPVDRVALVDGITAHVLDFDDTHLETVLHPSAPTMSGLFPLAQWKGTSGERSLLAWIAGIELACRVAIALGREHYDLGWHVTGTAGVFGAAVACAMVLDLDEDRFAHSLGIAATLASGHREQFGSMTKSLHAGAAGMHGLTAALLAAGGYDAAPQAIEGRRGLLNVMSPKPYPDLLLAGLGSKWDLLDNELKPYACGVVTHPVIDGTRALKEEHGLTADRIQSIELRVHPLVGELTAKEDPRTGLEAKFSVIHCAAVGLLRGRAGPDEFSDETANDPTVVALRKKVKVYVDRALPHMTAAVDALTLDGRTVRVDVTQARGTHDRPLTAAEVKQKFVSLAGPADSSTAAGALFERFFNLDREESLTEVVALTSGAGPSRESA